MSYCAKEGINHGTFCYWRNRIKKIDSNKWKTKVIDLVYQKSLGVQGMLKQLEKICKETDKAIALFPDLAIAYARKGTIYYRLGDEQRATVNWNIALKLDPEYDEVRDILEAMKTNNLKSADIEEKE